LAAENVYFSNAASSESDKSLLAIFLVMLFVFILLFSSITMIRQLLLIMRKAREARRNRYITRQTEIELDDADARAKATNTSLGVEALSSREVISKLVAIIESMDSVQKAEYLGYIDRGIFPPASLMQGRPSQDAPVPI
jgi:hypothetical protein